MEGDLKDSAMKDSAWIFMNFHKDQDHILGRTYFSAFLVKMARWTPVWLLVQCYL